MRKRTICTIAFILMILTVLAVSGCNSSKKDKDLRIDVPAETVTAELGTYDIPKPDVVNGNGLILQEYTVKVTKVTDPDGEEVKVAFNKIDATKVGVYEITYSAEGVDDAVLKVDFADRTPPVVSLDKSLLPEYYISGFDYAIPAYSVIDGPALEKCYVKVFYIAEGSSDRAEVPVENSIFHVDRNTGSYVIQIHVEDAVGNKKDYEYEIAAMGPSTIVPGKILYFDEKFGVAQVKTYWNGFKFSYSTDKAYGDEAGSMKVVCEGTGDYVILDKLLEKDVSSYTHLVVRVYNANDFDVYSGFCWFGDCTLKAKEWTEIKIPVNWLDTKNVSHPGITGITINSRDITNLSMRLFNDYDTNTVPAGSVFYFSAMYAITENYAPEEVVADKILYFDEEYGTHQVSVFWGDANTVGFDESVKFGDEKGSLRVTYNHEQQFNYIILDAPYIKDISAYDYIGFNVYNPTDHAFLIQLTWCGDTMVQPNSWTEVRFPTSLFGEGKVSNVDSTGLTASDITSLPICFWGEGFAADESFFISAVYGGMNEPEDPPQENTVVEFTGKTSLSRVSLMWGDAQTLYFDDSVKLGDEKGSLRITYNHAQEFNYLIIGNPVMKDITDYDYITFSVCNPTEHEFIIQLLWAGDTTVKANGWTEVRFPVSLFTEKGITDVGGNKILPEDLTNLAICFWGNGFEEGESIYLSAVTCGCFEPEEEPDDNVIAEFSGEASTARVSLLWGDAQTLSFDDSVKFGDEKGSLKVSYNHAQEFNYFIINNPVMSDISGYDAVVFHVYNPTDHEFTVQLLWAGDTTVKANGWTEVRFPVSLFSEKTITTQPGKQLHPEDITDLAICFWGNGFEKDECFWFSAFVCEKDA